jgi:tripartite-type tricarboxylate transporter receptor subunit TctC
MTYFGTFCRDWTILLALLALTLPNAAAATDRGPRDMLAPGASAQPYPSRPVRIVVPVSAGGGVDSLARLVGQHFNAVWGQPFIVDNRSGAGGTIGVDIVARAAADGYTLLVSSSSLVTNAAIRQVRYDPIRDFQPVTKLTTPDDARARCFLGAAADRAGEVATRPRDLRFVGSRRRAPPWR